MSRIVVVENLTLDGVMQSPSGPDEDVRDGFEHGGWAAPYDDEVKGRKMGEGMGETEALLLGRRTYEHFFSYWPTAPQPNPFTDVLNNTQKYVASRTLTEPLAWMNSTLLEGDAADAVGRLRERPGRNIVVLGSGDLVNSLMRRNLVDEFVLVIHPVLLGSGRRLFADGTSPSQLRLTDSVTTTTGVVIGTYLPTEQDGEA